MKSTGEAMGIDVDFGRAYCKSQFGALQNVPTGGTVFLSVKDADKTPLMASVARQLSDADQQIMMHPRIRNAR